MLSPAARLQVDLSKRYGCLVSGVNDIKSHPWLRSIDWGALKSGKLTPPIKCATTMTASLHHVGRSTTMPVHWKPE